MTMEAADLGVLGDLSTALGIMQDGSPDAGWFGDPSARLKTVLSDDGQRDALVSFLDSVLDDGAVDADDQGRTFVPIVTHTDPKLTVGIVLDPTATTVRVGLGVELETDAVSGGQARPATHTRLDVTVLQTARGDAPAPDPVLLLGHPGGRIRLQSSIELDAGTPAPGEFHLGGIGVQVDVPTTTSGDDPPAIGLQLKSLQLPGGQARDFDLSLDSADHLEDTVVELVLGLVRAQAATDAGPLHAIASLLGLTDDLPPLPVDQLLSVGVPALTAWLDGVLSNPTSRATWLGTIADLLPGAGVSGDTVEVTFGIATCHFRVRTEPGPSGHLRVVPSLDLEIGGSGAQVQATVDLFRTDLGTGATQALPRLGLWAHLGRNDGGSEPLALDVPAVGQTPAVQVEAVRVGVQLDDTRRPTFVLAADRVTIGAHGYPTLDLTSTDALMDAVGAAVDTVLGNLLDGLGDAGNAARLLLGLSAPAGHPTVSTVSLPDLAADPLGTFRGYWQTLVTTHPDAFAELLGVVGEVIGTTGTAVSGTGTADDPWHVPLGAVPPTGFELQVFAVGSELHLGVAGTTRVDAIGNRCTVVEGTLDLELATIDLAGGHASVMTGLGVALRLRGRGLDPERAVLDIGPVRFEADRVGIALRWTPAGGAERRTRRAEPGLRRRRHPDPAAPAGTRRGIRRDRLDRRRTAGRDARAAGAAVARRDRRSARVDRRRGRRRCPARARRPGRSGRRPRRRAANLARRRGRGDRTGRGGVPGRAAHGHRRDPRAARRLGHPRPTVRAGARRRPPGARAAALVPAARPRRPARRRDPPGADPGRRRDHHVAAGRHRARHRGARGRAGRRGRRRRRRRRPDLEP